MSCLQMLPLHLLYVGFSKKLCVVHYSFEVPDVALVK